MSIYDSIHETLSKKGINTVTGNMYDMMELWKSWYRGNVNDFHYYNVTLADGTVSNCERLTMNMPKKVAEDFAKLLWSEKVQISLDSDKKTKRLWEVLDNKKNNFSIMFPQIIEKGFALGTSVLVEYIDNGETRIDYIDGDMVIPYEYTNGYISGMITMSQFCEGTGSKKAYYTHLTYHEFKKITKDNVEKTMYIKLNELYKSKDSNSLGKEVSFEEKYPNVKNPLEYETDTPHFQIIRPNIVNNFDMSSPLGLSIYANSIDKFKSIDTKYDSFNNEFELGKKRILVDRTAIKQAVEVDASGNVSNVSYFDRNDKAYVAINGMEKQQVKEIDFTLRYEEHIRSINADLNYLSASVGLGQNYYEFDGQAVKTATEVVSENSDTYRTKNNHQIVIKDVLYDLIKSILFLEGMSSKEIKIEFDDSIIEDENTKKEKAQVKVEKGLMSKYTYLTKYEGMTETEAKIEMQRIQEENKIIMPEGIDFMGMDSKQNNKSKVTEEK